MNKIKAYIDWEYKINPETHHNWTNSPIEDCDIIISVNRCSKFKKKTKSALWMLEPEAIEPDIYRMVKNKKINYDFIVSHRDKLSTLNNYIKIYPCVPSWIEENDRKLFEKTKNISMIASTKIMCDGHRYRQKVAEQIKDVADLYGRGRENRIEHKINGLKDYRFSIAMENSCEDTYFTEKIIDCFFTGTIPIYWGTNKILDIFNSEGVIMLEDFIKNLNSFNYEKEYEKRYNSIKQNFEIAKKVNFTSTDGIHQIIEKIII